VALETDGQKTIETAVSCFGKLNILYNNAVVLWRDRDFVVTRTDKATWDKIMAINLKGTVWVCKYGVPELIKQRGGAIVNIGSGTALMGFTVAQDAYTASKGALASLTRSLGVVYAKDGIRTNIIHPGPVDTPMQTVWDKATRTAISDWVPLGRLATAEDIAYCGLFLASDESAYITGFEDSTR